MLNKEAKLRIEYNRKRRGARHLNHLVRSDKCTLRELDAAIYRYFGPGAAWRVFDRTLPMQRVVPSAATLSPVRHIVNLFIDPVVGKYREFVVWPFGRGLTRHFDVSITGMRKLARMSKEEKADMDKLEAMLFPKPGSRPGPIRAFGESELNQETRKLALNLYDDDSTHQSLPNIGQRVRAAGEAEQSPGAPLSASMSIGDTSGLEAMYPKGHTFWKVGGPELSPENYTEEERQASMAANAKKEDEANGFLLQGSPMRRTIEGHLADRTDHPMDPLLQEKPDAEHQG